MEKDLKLSIWSFNPILFRKLRISTYFIFYHNNLNWWSKYATQLMKHIRRYPLILVITILTSCNVQLKTKTIKISEPPKIENAIDLVFKTVLDEEIQEVGKKIYIVDQSMGKSISKIADYNFIENDTLENYIWDKKIYKSARYLNKNLISKLKENNFEKYLRKIRELTNYEWSWYEIWVPAFSKDRKTAIIEIEFNRSIANRNFYRRFAYVLEWRNDKYQKIDYIPIRDFRQ